MSSITRGRPWQVWLFLFAGTGCAAALNTASLTLTDQPAEITLPANGMPADFSQIRATLATGSFGHGAARQSTRDGCAGCPSVSVEIQSIGRTTDIDPAQTLHALRVIGRVRNNSANAEGRYGLKGGTEYLIYVEPMPYGAPGATWGLFELPAGGIGPAKWMRGGVVQVCHHYFNPHPSSDTDFRDYSECDTPVNRAGYQMRAEKPVPGPNDLFSPFGSVLKQRKAVFAATSGIWFECTPGCCVGS